MIAENARLTEIIMVQRGAELNFFTKEGVYIGSIIEGEVKQEKLPVDKDPDAPTERPGPKGGVVKSLTPDQLRVQEAKHNEKVMTGEVAAKEAVEKNLASWQKGE